LGKISTMLWSECAIAKNRIKIEEIINKKRQYIIHWAGHERGVSLLKYTRSDILLFFLREYYKKQKFGLIKYYLKVLFIFVTNRN
ncbi:hypothetical protein KKD03_01370, partial [Patescibacteria group bacterium]|nr:hypothetical protein [Patescibacteria group bacterium]